MSKSLISEEDRAIYKLHQLIFRETGMETERNYSWRSEFMLNVLTNFGLGYNPRSDYLTLSQVYSLERMIKADEELRDRFVAAYCPSTVWFDRNEIGGKVVSKSRELGEYRVLSAGCSKGSEVYSIAIAFLEAGINLADVILIGVDVNQKAIEQAMRGVYLNEEFDHPYNQLPAELRTKYFSKQGNLYVASEELTSGVEFKRCNLVNGEEVAGIAEEKFSVICCRNVLKYFDNDNAEIIINNLQQILEPSGIFFCSADGEENRRIKAAGFEEVGKYIYKKSN